MMRANTRVLAKEKDFMVLRFVGFCEELLKLLSRSRDRHCIKSNRYSYWYIVYLRYCANELTPREDDEDDVNAAVLTREAVLPKRLFKT